MRTFPKKLKRIMEESGLTHDEFAKRTKVSRASLYNFLSGRTPTLKFIINLVEYDPEIDLNWLIKDRQYKRDEVLQVVREDRESAEKTQETNDYIKMLEKALNGLKNISRT